MSSAVYAAATLADIALSSTLAAGPVERARDDKHNKALCDSIWHQWRMHAYIRLDWLWDAVYLSVWITYLHGYRLVPSG